MLNNIRIVLINTFHPGNIGAAARAMKNMGLSDLYLVDPKEFPHPEAESRAAGATALLDSATVVPTLRDAVADCALVIGTSARRRSFPWPMLDPETCADKALQQSVQGPVAIVFGRERMGMHNDELMQCNFHLAIPAAPDYPVMNISAAVQVVCYEIWKRHDGNPLWEPEEEYPTSEQMNRFYQHLEDTLRNVGFIIPQHEGQVMTKLRRFFNRARPEEFELGMLRGILRSVQKSNEESKKS